MSRHRARPLGVPLSLSMGKHKEGTGVDTYCGSPRQDPMDLISNFIFIKETTEAQEAYIYSPNQKLARWKAWPTPCSL